MFPVALIEEHAGTFWNWEHRPGVVNTVIRKADNPMSDLRVLAALADAMGTPLGVRTVDQAATELAELGAWEGARPAVTAVPAGTRRTAARNGGYRVATWRQLLDGGRGMDGEAALAATAKPAVARVSPATAAGEGLVHGGEVTVVTEAGGHFTLPLEVADDMVDGTVWLPTNAPGVSLGEYGVLAGDTVQLNLGGVA